MTEPSRVIFGNIQFGEIIYVVGRDRHRNNGMGGHAPLPNVACW